MVSRMAESKETITYLTDAAHLLQLAVPETSAYLMNQRNALLSHSEQVPSDVQRQHVCAACGHIMLGDGRSSLSLQSSKTRQKARAHQEQALRQADRPCKVVRCDQCDRYSETLLDVPSRATRLKSNPMPVNASSKMDPKQTSNASSKKRAKNRKAGLQALLSGQQKKKSGAEALKLSDFIR